MPRVLGGIAETVMAPMVAFNLEILSKMLLGPVKGAAQIEPDWLGLAVQRIEMRPVIILSGWLSYYERARE